MSAPRDLVATLRERGLVHQVTDEALGALSSRESLVLYNGFDPSAPTLHAGSLYPVMILAHAARAGERPAADEGDPRDRLVPKGGHINDGPNSRLGSSKRYF